MTNKVVKHEAPGKGKVQVRHCKAVPVIESTSKLDNMKQWPNGKDIMEAFSQERLSPKQRGDETFWQTAFRWSLLRKYNKCPDHLKEPYSFVVEEPAQQQSNNNNTNNIVTPPRPTKRQKKDDDDDDDDDDGNSISSSNTETTTRSTNNNPRKVLKFSKEDVETITKLWEEQCDLAVSAPAATQQQNNSNNDEDDDDLREFLVSATSNGRPLQWTFLDCGPACQFKLHAHPNMEMIYCVSGALHEIRMEGKPITKDFPAAAASDHQQNNEEEDLPHDNKHEEIKGPNLASLGRPWKFDTLLEGDILVNEVGSIHRSFCATNGGCLLFVLWGGSHADIPAGQEPRSVNIQQAMDTMDQRISSQQQQQQQQQQGTASTNCGCGSSWATLSETFLPESERSI